MTNAEMLAELHHIYLFSALNRDQLSLMMQGMHELHLECHERLFDYGQAADRFYYLAFGLIKLFRVSADGDEKVIEVVQPGKTFAEAILFMDQRRYPVSAEAIEASVLYSFDMAVFRRLLEESRETCFKMMADMSRRLHSRVNEIDQLTLKNATYRMVSYLLEQARGQQGSTVEVILDTPKNVIASHLSIQPETFSRILLRLKKQNLIDVDGSRVHLYDVSRLQSLLLE